MKAFKDKRMVVVLLVAVTVVWGMIIYRVVGYSGDGEIPVSAGVKKPVAAKGVPDTLRLDYRDPFLGTVERVAERRRVEEKPRIVMEEPECPPMFRFAGKIRKGKRDFWLVESGGETRLVGTGEKSIEDYRVEKVYPDSVCLRKGNRVYTLRIDL